MPIIDLLLWSNSLQSAAVNLSISDNLTPLEVSFILLAVVPSKNEEYSSDQQLNFKNEKTRTGRKSLTSIDWHQT